MKYIKRFIIVAVLFIPAMISHYGFHIALGLSGAFDTANKFIEKFSYAWRDRWAA